MYGLVIKFMWTAVDFGVLRQVNFSFQGWKESGAAIVATPSHEIHTSESAKPYSTRFQQTSEVCGKKNHTLKFRPQNFPWLGPHLSKPPIFLPPLGYSPRPCTRTAPLDPCTHISLQFKAKGVPFVGQRPTKMK